MRRAQNQVRGKSEAIWRGASSNSRHKPAGIKWSDGVVTCLGIQMNADMVKVIGMNFTEKSKKVGYFFEDVVRKVTNA